MRIEFVRDYPPYRPGQVTDYPHGGAADVLIRRGIARLPVVAGVPAAVAPSGPPKPAAAKPRRQGT